MSAISKIRMKARSSSAECSNTSNLPESIRRRCDVLPPHTLSKGVIETIRKYTHAMARELKVIGLMNVQYAVKGEKVFVLEVNPRASRTVPFVSKRLANRSPNSRRKSWPEKL